MSKLSEEDRELLKFMLSNSSMRLDDIVKNLSEQPWRYKNVTKERLHRILQIDLEEVMQG